MSLTFPGDLSLTGAEYLQSVVTFTKALELDLSGSSIVTMALSLTSVTTSLTTEQVTTLTTIMTQLTTLLKRFTLLTEEIGVAFEELTGAKATELQVSAGSASVTTNTEASNSFLLVLQSVTVNKKAMAEVRTVLTGLISSGSLEVSGTEKVTGAEYLLRMKKFLLVTERDFSATSITALSFSLTKVTVTLTFFQQTMLTFYIKTITYTITRMSLAISFYQGQFKVLTGTEATETQILTGDTSSTNNTFVTSTLVKLTGLKTNSKRTDRMRMLCGSIAEDAVAATSNGSIEITTMELFSLVMEFYTFIYTDFYYTENIGALVTKIQFAKLTTALTTQQVTEVQRIVVKLKVLTTNIDVTYQTFAIQYELVTGLAPSVNIVDEKPNPDTAKCLLLQELKALTLSSQVSWWFVIHRLSEIMFSDIFKDL